MIFEFTIKDKDDKIHNYDLNLNDMLEEVAKKRLQEQAEEDGITEYEIVEMKHNNKFRE